MLYYYLIKNILFQSLLSIFGKCEKISSHNFCIDEKIPQRKRVEISSTFDENAFMLLSVRLGFLKLQVKVFVYKATERSAQTFKQ